MRFDWIEHTDVSISGTTDNKSTLPAKSALLTLPPFTSFTSKSGAAWFTSNGVPSNSTTSPLNVTVGIMLIPPLID